ncbi:hypothetical protein TSTA_058600 [Talaromyces stipitatus ATCC 10500]|uniref:C6 transcription factor n=1 Tax=Talaromyces stipitatus (strain ATCC 10500 / CBS 375.48 / QM 6759 / NRRL 1006) TaxID=441959 RepID=B8MQG9_TALSN|nr:uncharacterized protein TSTA_058600 [Talaromyces stipitatus ATCC 10500]EED13371.1 hypothetical protein TSTA_058600 [Talaromyces stipitatus ATCC 10500]
MDQHKFVFLNTTNAPVLSPEATRLMRGHITQSNFDKRRQQIANTTEKAKIRKKKRISCKKKLEHSAELVSANQDLQVLIHLTCLNPPGSNPSEAAWVELFGSNPALVEATMAIGTRHWSPQPSWQWQADMCSSNALQSIIQQISWRQTHTDGFLAAVLTMAFGARLMHSDSAWEVHADGLVQIIRERRSQGVKEPAWFYDLLIMKIIDAIGDSGGLRIRQIAEICEGVIAMRKSINMYHMGHSDNESVLEDIEEGLTRLREKSQKLGRRKNNEYVQATVLTLELILDILWPQGLQSDYTKSLVEELQETSSRLPKIPCPYMDLTSCQLIIGAVAAESGSSTRIWFVSKLTSAARAMQERGWAEPFQILERVLRSDTSLMEWFNML